MSLTRATAASDVTLIEVRPAGEDAFEEVFRRHYATVYRVLLRLTGSPEEAEDLAQDVFLRLYQRPLPSGEGVDVNLAGWLYRVASNQGFNALRARRRGRNRLLRWARLERPVVAEPANPQRQAEVNAEAEAVRLALARLRERDRTALILRYSGVPYAEIATALGVKPGSVGTILVRAERALRERYLAMNPSDREV